jgi:hypothetical protein
VKSENMRLKFKSCKKEKEIKDEWEFYISMLPKFNPYSAIN